ncbi:MAG TPA: MBL fold metallo-hydrolase [Saprospiraceae bacterium]|nr:MBL fold metallo-hydrolase [Saprospiraceae bacterium]
MEITFLGTGTSQGIPVICCDCKVCLSGNEKDKRTRTSLFVDTGSEKIVVDVGPDFRQQMLREKITHLDGVLITHEHNDHVVGLDDIRPYYFKESKPLSFYMRDHVKKEIINRFPYVFSASQYPGVPRINIHEIIPYQSFQMGATIILPLPVQHGQMEVMAFRWNHFLYITDASYIPEKSLSAMKGIDTMVINALRHQSHYSHFSLSQALQIIDIIQPKTAYLTHISHYLGLHIETSATLPPSIHLAYDGLKITVND